MDRAEWKEMFREVMTSLKHSMKTGDYRGLDKEIGNAVGDKVEVVIQDVLSAIKSTQENQGKASSTKDSRTKNEAKRTKATYVPFKENKTRGKEKSSNVITYAHHPIGKVSGILYSILGWTGTLSIGIALIVLGIIGLATGALFSYFLPLGILAPFFLGSALLTINGGRIRKRYQRYRTYLSFIGQQHYVNIEEISKLTGKSKRYVYKDLRKMTRLGMFPQGILDQDKDMFYLSKAGYEQFTYLEEIEKERVKEKEFSKQEKMDAENGQQDILDMGKYYLQRINDLSSKITNKKVRENVTHMEAVVIRIMEYIGKHPNQKEEVRRLMEYYLPTTIKILAAYEEFEGQPSQGENILKTKQEIEHTLDVINEAFENLLDSLFEDVYWDISSDIAVMETMLKEEGLAKNLFRDEKKAND